MACDSRGIGTITGPAGIGKTESLRAARIMRPNSIYHRVLSTERSCLGLIRALARHVGVSMHRSISVTQTAIIDRLTGSDRALLIDEAQKLEHRALEVLRDINDCAGVPVVLVGTVNVKALVDDTGANFGQFSSRIVARYDAAEDIARQSTRPGGRTARPAQLFSAEEIVQMFEGSQLRLADDAVGMLTTVANALGHGSLRLVAKLVSIASMHQRVKAKGEIDRGILVAILRQFYGDAYVECISERSEQLGGERLALTA
ncbi:MAG: ATP-binding protein [Phycisphaerales bacterium]|nr:ATP-binding protein [Phycisphaerales bacterium]